MNWERPEQSAHADAFTREVIRNRLLAIAGEMGIVLARTSMSPIVYEVLDFACGITDTEARMRLKLISSFWTPSAEGWGKKRLAQDA